MRNLAMAMVLMGILFTVVLGVLALQGAAAASVIAGLVPALALVVAGGFILQRARD